MEAWVNALCREAFLGTPVRAPRPVSGGLTHQMYDMETTMGRYAVKRLNPAVMARPEALANLRHAAELEAVLEPLGLPILPALAVSGEKILPVGGAWCCVFPWFDGRMIRGGAVTAAHAAAVGAALAGIHAAARRERPSPPEPFLPDWDALLSGWPALRPYGDLLKRLTDRSNEARLRLPTRQTVCHNDLDTKNVLWRDDGTFRIIDLECLNWGCPEAELLETALYWSGLEEHRLNRERFAAFLGAYRDAGGDVPPDGQPFADADQGRLGWLAWSMTRGDAAEVDNTLARILCVEDARAEHFFSGGKAWTN